MPTRTATTLPVTELTVAEGNYSLGRENTPIDRIVLHTMVGTTDSADRRFNTFGTQVSATYGVKLNGEIVHWVDEDNTAYANGNWQMNLRAISIEHEDNGDFNGPRTPLLYLSSSKLVAELCKFYSIPCDRAHIIGHKEVPFPTACPDALDMDRIVAGAKQILNPTAAEPLVCDPASVRDMLVAKASNWDQVADMWKLTPEQRVANNEGNWIVEQIKQIQTVDIALKGQLLRFQTAQDSPKTQDNPTGAISTPSSLGTPVSVVVDPAVAQVSPPIDAKHMSLLQAFLSVFWKL